MNGRPRSIDALRALSPSQVLVVAVVGLLPVVHSGALFRSYRSPQLALLIVAVGGMCALLLKPSLEWLQGESRSIQVTVASIGAALLWMTVAALTGVDPVRSFAGDSLRSAGLVLWYASAGLFLLSLRHRRALYQRVADATIFAWLILLVFLGLWLALPAGTKDLLLLVSPDGVPLPGMGQSVYLAAFAGVGLLVAAGRWLSTPRQAGWIFLAAILCAFLVLTHARVPVAVTALALPLGIAALVKSDRRRLQPPMVLGLLAVVLSAGIVSQVWLVPLTRGSGSKTAGDSVSLPEKLSPTLIADGLQVRQTWWSVAVRAAASQPIAGNGPANFAYSYRSLVDLDQAESVPDPNIEVGDAHNLLLEVAATSGVAPAILLLVAGMGLVFSMRDPPDPGLIWIRLGLCVLAATMLTQPVALSVLPLLGIFAGVSAGGAVPVAGQRNAWSRARLLPAGVLVTLSVVLAGLLIRSDQLLARGSLEWDSQTLQRARSLDPTCQECLYELGKVRSWDFKREGRGTLASALAPFELAVARHPLDSESHLRLGSGLIFLERPRDALGPLSTARRLHPHSPRIAIALGAAQLQTGNPRAGLRNVLAAIDIQPSAIAWELAAEAYSQLGQVDQARSALAEAERLAESSD